MRTNNVRNIVTQETPKYFDVVNIWGYEHIKKNCFPKKYDSRLSMKLHIHIPSRYIFFIYISLGFTSVLPGWWIQLPRNKALVNSAIRIRGLQKCQTPVEIRQRKGFAHGITIKHLQRVSVLFVLPNKAKVSVINCHRCYFLFFKLLDLTYIRNHTALSPLFFISIEISFVCTLTF